MYNLPNILTISRIVVIPVIFLSVYINNSIWWSLLVAILFVAAAITDYFDGYFARSRNQLSVLGKLLDPIADKLLVFSALIVIIANKMVLPVSYIPVMIILCREVLVSGLREFLANVKVGMPVTRLAKWKTGFQMTALSMILFENVPYFGVFGYIGEVLLWIAGILTFITGYEYFQKSLDYVKSVENEKKPNKKVMLEKAVKETDNAKKAAEAKKEPAKKPAVKKTVKKEAEKTTSAKKPVAKKPAAKKAKTVKTKKQG